MFKEIEKRIKEASQKYYTDGTSEISDTEFDSLLEKLKHDDPESPLLGVGHGYDICEDTTPGEKVKHKYGTVGSLDKCRTWDELSKTIRSEYVCCSLKLDGLSVVLYYEKNRLVRALTRGDGETGIDITDKVLRIWPKYIKTADEFTGAIRGEILMPYSEFERYKLEHPEMKNPRNTCAGIINSKDGMGIEYLKLIVYTIIGHESSSYVLCDYEWMHDKLIEWFGKENVVFSTESFELSPHTFTLEMDRLKSSWYGVYPADGIVITSCSSKKEGSEIVYDANAFKFPSEIKQSEVVEIQWNMSKTRYAIPKVRIEPIELAGTTVEWCTGYNADYIRKNKLGPGSIVTVEKRGEIIPNIQTILKSSEEPSIIYTCPDCGTKLEWKGVHLYCPNENCINATDKDTAIWIQKLVSVDGLGDKLILKFINTLVNSNIIKDGSIESIMESSQHLPEDTSSAHLNLFSKVWNKLHDASEKITLADALQAINVPRIGGITSIKFASYPDIVRRLCYEGMSDELYSELRFKLGEANALSCCSNINKFKRLKYLYDNDRITKSLQDPNIKHVAVTGKLSVKRSDFEKELNLHGFSLTDITKDTKFLITDDPNSNSSKNKKADKFGIIKITEKEFREKYL